MLRLMLATFAGGLLLFAAVIVCVPRAHAAGRVCGEASWYGPESGSMTASGAHFRPDGLSAAMWGVPFGSRYRVTYRGKSVVVVINDRGPARRLHRIVDLSRGAARRIGFGGVGLLVAGGVTVGAVLQWGGDGRVTLIRHDGDKLVYVVTIHDALVDGRVQVSAEGVEKA